MNETKIQEFHCKCFYESLFNNKYSGVKSKTFHESLLANFAISNSICISLEKYHAVIM